MPRGSPTVSGYDSYHVTPRKFNRYNCKLRARRRGLDHRDIVMPVWLIDGNNVRGVLHFPDLGAFCAAVRFWAQSQSVHQAALVVLALDHGTRGEAFPLGGRFVIAFSSNTTDADTVIAHASDALLDSHHEVVVITSDQLLKQRCRHALPTSIDEVPYGEKRSPVQLARLRFEGSASFAQHLNLALPSLSPSASPLDHLMVASTSFSMHGRRMNGSESTAERTRTSSRLHAAIAGHHGSLPAPATRSPAVEWAEWHASLCPFRMIQTTQRSAAIDGSPPASARDGDGAHTMELWLGRAPVGAIPCDSQVGPADAVEGAGATWAPDWTLDWRLGLLLLAAMMIANGAAVWLMVAFECGKGVLLSVCPALLVMSTLVMVRTRRLWSGPIGGARGGAADPHQTVSPELAGHGNKRARPQRKKPRSRRAHRG